jgi:hypothetical protein
MQAYNLAGLVSALIIGTSALPSTTMAASQGCALTSATNWTIPAARGSAATTLRVIGRSSGRSCAKAALSYTILNARGRVVFRQTYQSDAVATFIGVRTQNQMRGALTDWIRPVNGVSFRANLPDWLVGADGPVEREFGFTPAETMTREEYLGIKGDRTPIRCYVQGIESINCLIYHGGVVDPFGVQQFPG